MAWIREEKSFAMVLTTIILLELALLDLLLAGVALMLRSWCLMMKGCG